MVDENAIAAVGDVERHALVCLVRACTAVAIPHADGLTYASLIGCKRRGGALELTVLDECTKLLSQTIHQLSRGQVELRTRVPNGRRQHRRQRIRVELISQARRVGSGVLCPFVWYVEQSVVLLPRASKFASLRVLERQGVWLASDLNCQTSCTECADDGRVVGGLECTELSAANWRRVRVGKESDVCGRFGLV